jgi:hypothetical protein
MLPPSERNGAFGDQKGPKMADEVGVSEVSAADLCAISSTRLMMLETHSPCGNDVRFQPEDIGYALTLVALGVTNLTDGVEELDAGHPLVRGQFDLTRKLVDMANQS